MIINLSGKMVHEKEIKGGGKEMLTWNQTCQRKVGVVRKVEKLLKKITEKYSISQLGQATHPLPVLHPAQVVFENCVKNNVHN